MKNLWTSFCIACSMYSRIPVPQVDWTEKGMKYALCFFPLIGVAIGAVLCFYQKTTELVTIGPVAYACLGTVIPILITGGIHMDGFLDVVDALSSYQTRERKLEIMKDPHTGAFAIIGCAVYLLIYAAAISEVGCDAYPGAAAIFVLSRAFSGFAVVTFPKAKKDGLVSTFSMQAEHRTVRVCLGIWAFLAVVWMIGFFGICHTGLMLLIQLAVLLWYYRLSIREFGGVTGDLAGFFLQIEEVISFILLAILY